MRSRRGFTLIEMLAVVSIMLILLGVSYGVLSSLAQQTGPDAVLVTVQAAIHNARDYAAGYGVPTRIEFRFTDPNTDDPMPSSTIRLQCWSDRFNDWIDMPGREPIALPQGIFVCKGFPNSLPQTTLRVGSVTNLTEQQVQQWQLHEQEVLDEVAEYALRTGSSELRDVHDEFYIVYGPEGYPVPSSRLSTPYQMNASDVVGGGGAGASGAAGLTLVRVSGTRVSTYAFYLWNQNAGTRMVFE